MTAPIKGDYQREAGSFRDPSGFVFFQNQTVYRQINQGYSENYQLLKKTGLYDVLIKKDFLVSHREVTVPPPLPELAYKVIQPDVIPFISYPYEWCFSQLKSAALLTLEIAILALQHGMVLKDASAYNVQFVGSRPIFIDTLSFENYKEGGPWVAYRQFCQHFLAPLALMSLTDLRLNTLLRQYIDGVPLDLAVKLLPRKTRLKLGLLTHLYLHASSQQRLSTSKKPVGAYRLPKESLLGLLHNLRATVTSLHFPRQATEWGKYYQNTNYSNSAADSKKSIITDWLKRVKPNTVLDMGANSGEYSQLADEFARLTIACDFDQKAVEYNYRTQAEKKSKTLLPLVINLVNPSPGLGWVNEERGSFLERAKVDLVLCLAVVHHLAISNNLPLESIAKMLQKQGKWLVIEFVPKSDSNTQLLLSSREDIFPDYTQEGFEKAFARYYSVRQKQAVTDSKRVLYLMERKDEKK